jgi:hypothetical protein
MNRISMYGVIALVAFGAAVGARNAVAQQMAQFKDVDVHYVVFNTLFLEPDIAAQYGVPRARDRALLNVSVIGSDGMPQAATLDASYANLLGQRFALPLTEVREGSAVYYIGAFRYTDRDTLRFRIAVRTENGARHEVTFQQQMFLEGR